MGVANETFAHYEREESESRGIVVPVVWPERVSLGRGRKIGAWVGGAQAGRFWRFSRVTAGDVCGAGELRRMIRASLPRGCGVTVGIFHNGRGLWTGKRYMDAKGEKHWIEGLIDVGLVPEGGWEQPGEGVDGWTWDDTTLMPVAWDPKECAGKEHICSSFSCVGEAIWDVQERILGGTAAGAVDYAGPRMVRRGSKC
jgi:hypothetical protein